MRVKYIIKYRKGQKQKRVIGFLHIPRDLPEEFTSQEFIEWICKRHNLKPEMELELTLKNYTNKKFRYDNTFGKTQKAAAKKASGNRN